MGCSTRRPTSSSASNPTDGLAFFALAGRFIDRGDHPAAVFEALGLDLFAEYDKRVAAGDREVFRHADLYPDAVPALASLREAGYFVGVAGNQPSNLEESVRAMSLPVDLIASSSSLGAAKPSPEFFSRLARRAGFDPIDCVSVGDRADNDVRPAKAIGMRSILVRRGPWALLEPDDVADAVAHSLVDVHRLIESF